MKKRNSKLLQLNKQSISTLQKHQVMGGNNTIYTITVCTLEHVISVVICTPDPTDTETDVPIDGDPDETIAPPGSITVCIQQSVQFCY